MDDNLYPLTQKPKQQNSMDVDQASHTSSTSLPSESELLTPSGPPSQFTFQPIPDDEPMGDVSPSNGNPQNLSNQPLDRPPPPEPPVPVIAPADDEPMEDLSPSNGNPQNLTNQTLDQPALPEPLVPVIGPDTRPSTDPTLHDSAASVHYNQNDMCKTLIPYPYTSPSSLTIIMTFSC